MLRCANVVPSYAYCAQLSQSMSKCAKLCITVPNDQDKFIFSGLKCVEMYKNVPICAKPPQNVRNLLSYAQFGTVLHSLTYFSTDMCESTEICDETLKVFLKFFFRAHLRGQVFVVVCSIYKRNSWLNRVHRMVYFF